MNPKNKPHSARRIIVIFSGALVSGLLLLQGLLREKHAGQARWTSGSVRHLNEVTEARFDGSIQSTEKNADSNTAAQAAARPGATGGSPVQTSVIASTAGTNSQPRPQAGAQSGLRPMKSNARPPSASGGSAPVSSRGSPARAVAAPAFIPPTPEQIRDQPASVTAAQILSQRLDLSDPAVEKEVVELLRLSSETRRKAAWEKAGQLGLKTSGDTPGGGSFYLKDFIDGRPVYIGTANRAAARSTNTHEVRQFPAYSGVDGGGMTIGVWDSAGVRVTHEEFLGFNGQSRVVIKDGSTGLKLHPTHVVGTIAAAGSPNSSVRGMAPGVSVDFYDNVNDIAEMTQAGAVLPDDGKLLVANGSYGKTMGWEVNAAGGYEWFGGFAPNGPAGSNVESGFGEYNAEAISLDGIAFNKPYFLMVRAAGNERNDSPPPAGTSWMDVLSSITYVYQTGGNMPLGDGAYAGGYDCLGSDKTAKNILTVGAVNDAVSGIDRNVANGTMTDFSSWGAADDGRIKPDIMGNGFEVHSTIHTSDSAEGDEDGTSMACPNISGSAILLQQIFTLKNPATQPMRSATLKGLIIHTADDLGSAGPDYQNGWGLMNTKAAADVIIAHFNEKNGGAIYEDSTTAGSAPKTYRFNWDGTKELRVTLCWTDPPGTADTTDNDTNRDLVNDLDLEVLGPDGSTLFRPYVMPFAQNPATASRSDPATTGVNSTDNVEVVKVPLPLPAGLYTIGVKAPAQMQGSVQNYSLIVSGNKPPPELAVATANGTKLTAGLSAVSFGVLPAGAAAPAPMTLTIRNDGGSDLKSLGVSRIEGQAGSFTLTQPGVTTLAGGATTTFNVNFVGTQAGAHVALIRVTSTDATHPAFDIQVAAFRDSDTLVRTWQKADPVGEIVSIDPAGNVLAAGSVWTRSQYDPRITKYDGETGAIVWETNIITQRGSDLNESLSYIRVDSAGDVIFESRAPIQVNVTTKRHRAFTTKLDGTTGLIVWQRSVDFPTYPSGNTNYGTAGVLEVDASRNVLVARSTEVYNTQLFMVTKYSPAGDVLWHHETPGRSFNLWKRHAVDGAGNLYVDGKYDANTGIKLWGLPETGPSALPGGPWAVAVNPAGDMAAFGLYPNVSGNDVWVVKFNTGGVEQWRSVLDQVPDSDTSWHGDEYGSCVGVDAAGNVFINGVQDLIPEGMRCFTAKLRSADGQIIWNSLYQTGVGSYNSEFDWFTGDYGSAIVFDHAENPIITCHTEFGLEQYGYYFESQHHVWGLRKYASADGTLLWDRSGTGWEMSEGGLEASPTGKIVLVAWNDSAYDIMRYAEDVNAPPTLTLTQATVTVNEGQTAVNGGALLDPDPGDTITLTALIKHTGSNNSIAFGTITRDTVAGTWQWSAPTTDGPADGGIMTITASDGVNASVKKTFPLVVNNVAPVYDAGADVSLTPAQALSFSRVVSFTDPGADTWNAFVDFDDGGGIQPVSVNQAAKSFELSHLFSLPGVYDVRVVVGDGETADGVQASFKVTVQRLITDWRMTHFGTTDNTGAAADTADADGDGIPNLAEFAFNLDPKKGDGSGLPGISFGSSGSTLPGTSDDSGALDPKASSSFGPGDMMTISFDEPPATTGIIYGAESSTNLTSWQPITDTGTNGTHTFSVPVNTNTRLFMRLKVTTVP